MAIPTEKLSSFADVLSGYAFKSKEFTDSGIPVVKISNIRIGHIDLSDAVKVSEKHLELDKKFHVRQSDILISLTGSQMNQPNSVVGRVARVGRGVHALLNQRAGKVIITDTQRCDHSYLYYVLFSEGMRHSIAMMAHGAASQANVSPSAVASLEIPLPPLPTQRRIASILSAYDDLIENNNKRIKILEEMARMLYREWFVHFRLPGHEKVKMVDSPLGRIPEGWGAVKLADVCEVIKRGITPKYTDDSDQVVLNQKCIRNQKISLEPARRHIQKVPVEKYVRVGDVLINSTGVGTLGRVAQVHSEIPNCTVDTHVTIVRPNKGTNWAFFGAALFSMQVQFETMGEGATGQTELSGTRIGETLWLQPSSPFHDTFGENIGPMRSESDILQKKNQNLRQTRDLLLPKLICGEIDVDHLHIKGVA